MAVRGLLAMLVAGLATTILAGCAYSHDPYRVRLKNDTQMKVKLHRCTNDDCRFLEPGLPKPPIEYTLDPGESAWVFTSTHGLPKVWLVQNEDGDRLGCLPLVMPHPVTGLEARVSERLPCRIGLDNNTQWPPG
jgi:hypothetical protein